MRLFRSVRLMLLALCVVLLPAVSNAGVFVSVNFGPPALPVYAQPPCPEPGLIWTPGYWAYGPDGYYWVPGAWVPAPYEGALWTPGYWGYANSVYVWHPGYWGRHVGYYGGVNYGFGYLGIGFVGGEWRGGAFAYNTAAWNVNRTVVHNVYVNETIVHNMTIPNDHRVAFSGGPGGIRHDPRPEERIADRDQHIAPTSFQSRHEDTARGDHGAYFRTNQGRPQNIVASRPLSVERRPEAGGFQNRQGAMQENRPSQMTPSPRNQGNQPNQRQNWGNQNQDQNRSNPNAFGGNNRAQTQQWNQQQARPQQQQVIPQQQARPQQQQRFEQQRVIPQQQQQQQQKFENRQNSREEKHDRR